MLSILRFIMTATGLALIGLTVGGVLLLPQAERYAKPWFERGAANCLGTGVASETMRFSPLLPGFELTNLSVAGENADDEPLLTCERVAIRVDPVRLFAPEPAVEEVLFDGLEMHLLRGGGRADSVRALAERLHESSYLSRVEVRKIRCTNGRVKVGDAVLPGPGVTIPLETFDVEPEANAHGGAVALAAFRRLIAPIRGTHEDRPGLTEFLSELSESLAGTG